MLADSSSTFSFHYTWLIGEISGGRSQGFLILLFSSFLQVELKILGDSVLLGVDEEEVLHLRQVSGPLTKKPQPIMRIALGGLLFPASSLRLPVTASQGWEP